MAMSRKHYVEAAEIIANQVQAAGGMTPVRKAVAVATATRIAEDLAIMFKNDNIHFNRYRFLEAAGVK